MTKQITNSILLFLSLLYGGVAFSQHTFSIVAVDTETGEVGSAGASCVDNAANFGGVILISGIIPGRGAINGQATVCIPHINLNNGIAQMQNGLSPQEVLDYLFANDACQFGNANNRQYGVVDFAPDGSARSAAFTGSNALNYAGHRVGENYAIQGNILLGPQILDSMETRFINTDGPLAVKLMAAMQGANVPGADSRCLDEGTSSKSAFLRVARPGDSVNDLYLQINIAEEPDGTEPINSLQTAFDAWADTALVSTVFQPTDFEIKVFPNPARQSFNIEWNGKEITGLKAQFFSSMGIMFHQTTLQKGNNYIRFPDYRDMQMVFLKITDPDGIIFYKEKILIHRD